jgi:prolyl-tRNA synthetase
MSLPLAIAPFSAVITPVNYGDSLQRETADLLYAQCSNAGIDVILDDRDERAGVKFKDADLIGFPHRITVGKKVKEGKIEFVDRRSRQSEDVLLHDVVPRLQQLTAATLQ